MEAFGKQIEVREIWASVVGFKHKGATVWTVLNWPGIEFSGWLDHREYKRVKFIDVLSNPDPTNQPCGLSAYVLPLASKFLVRLLVYVAFISKYAQFS
jgi:hypothetical protein